MSQLYFAIKRLPHSRSQLFSISMQIRIFHVVNSSEAMINNFFFFFSVFVVKILLFNQTCHWILLTYLDPLSCWCTGNKISKWWHFLLHFWLPFSRGVTVVKHGGWELPFVRISKYISQSQSPGNEHRKVAQVAKVPLKTVQNSCRSKSLNAQIQQLFVTCW